MSTIADLLIKVRADTAGAEKDISGLGSKVSRGFGKALLPATAALGALGVVGKIAFDNLQDGANNAKGTEQVLKSTGGAAHVTASHVDDLAMSLRRKAGVDDDVVHHGENVLLTFTNIRNEVGKGNDIFDQATSRALDMSHALGQDMQSSVIQLGKALNDPIKGVTALQRVGVSFTAQQKEQIKTLQESGNVLGAQKIVLGEVTREFGGAATNIDPTTKALENMKLNAVDLASNLLKAAIPAMGVFVKIIGQATDFLNKHQEAAKLIIGVLILLSTTVILVNVAVKLWTAAQVIARAATVAWTGAQWLLNAALAANPIALVIIALVALGAALVIAWEKSDTFRRVVTDAWNAIKNTTVAVFDAIKAFFVQWWPLILGIATGGIGLIIALVVTHWDTVKNTTTAAWNAVRNAISGVVNGLDNLVGGALSAVVGVVSGKWAAVKSTTSGAWDSLRAIVSAAVGAVKAVVSADMGALGALVNAAAGAVRAGAAAIEGTFNGVINVLNAIVGAARSAASAIESVVSAAGKIGDIGSKIGGAIGHIPGFASGVRNFSGGLALVGEQGPELVSLPRGADVFNSGDTRQMTGGGGVNIQGDLVVREEADVYRVASQLGRHLAVAGL